MAFVIVELSAGYYYSSLALYSDAGHNLTDVSGLVISLIAFKMMNVKATNRFTYGYKKTSILASLLNAILLLFTVGAIIYGGIHRLKHPQPVQGNAVSIVAFIGIFINSISAWLFFKDKEKDINVKGAYLHLIADALVSLGVVVAGIIIIYTNWFWIDTAVSFVIAIVVLVSTWRLLTDSITLALDGVPKEINITRVEEAILKFKEIKSVHHIHIWALSSNQNALTAHLIVENTSLANSDKIKHKIKHELEHLNINHTTLEVETLTCDDNVCGDSTTDTSAKYT
jgi:cobalt-zinc-cadmium efflux system protein